MDLPSTKWGKTLREGGLEVLDKGAEFEVCPVNTSNARLSEALSQLNV